MELSELKLTDKRLLICNKLGLNNSDDILRYYPFKYENYHESHYKDFKEGEMIVFSGELISYPSTFRFKGNRSRTTFNVLCDEEVIKVTIFNRPWVKADNNSKIVIVGKYEGGNRVTATNFYSKDIKEIVGINPLYSLKEGINQNEIRKLIDYTYKKVSATLVDEIPSDFINAHHLISLKEALYSIHHPQDETSLKKAMAYLKYEEFLRFYLALEALKGNDNFLVKKEKKYDSEKLNNFIHKLGYELTPDQETSVNDILSDLKSNKPMYRLIQGEVGSGKTAVCMIGLYANYLAGFSGALMAPTEILAKQHYESFRSALNGLCNIGLLTSSGDNNEQVKKDLKNGKIDIIIGTHSLFQDDVIFNNLGMVVADEQHRFGVKQRRALKDKGECVDFLLMSATPIPRTLASSLYGDMDISTIETLPAGRKGCDTYLIKENSIKSIITDLKDILAKGQQIYIVASSIEQSDNYSGKDVTTLYNSLIDVFSPYKLGLLHGKMSSEEKDAVMASFKDNKIQVLVSTTVIEVGVNVKNATCMVIYDSDRFGLSQIHQLRGRVQRGSHKGTCYLLTSSKESETLNRLKVLVSTNDGFKIASADLKLRGPGDILGTRQSGLPVFILGNIFEDTKIIEASKRDAKEIASSDKYKDYYQKIADNAQKKYID